MPMVNYAHILFLVLKRAFFVMAVAVPAIIFLLVASAFGPSGSGAGFGIVLTAALCGLAWAFLPLVHAGRRGGLVFGVVWSALALWHFIAGAESAMGAIVTCWLLATLFLAGWLKAQPPDYFPQSWKTAEPGRNFDSDA